MATRTATTILSLLLSAAAAGMPLAAQTPSPEGASKTASAPPPVPGAATQEPASTAPAAAPKFVADQPIQDVGTVAKGEKVKVDFTVRNAGTAELILNDVRPTCGCTVASFDAKIPVGGSGQIHAEIDTVDFSGPIAKTIAVLTNDPAQPRTTLTIKAKVEPHIIANPSLVRFVYVQNQAPATVKQWLWAESFPELKILSVKSPYSYVTTTFHLATAEERRPELVGATQWVVESTIQQDAAVGALRDFLVIETNHPKQKELRIPLSGFVRPLLAVTPEVSDFGSLQLSAASQDVSLVLVNFGTEPLEVKGVKASVPGVESQIKTIEAGKRWEIKLTLTGKMPRGRTEATVTIETSSSRQPTVTTTLRGTVN